MIVECIEDSKEMDDEYSERSYRHDDDYNERYSSRYGYRGRMR